MTIISGRVVCPLYKLSKGLNLYFQLSLWWPWLHLNFCHTAWLLSNVINWKWGWIAVAAKQPSYWRTVEGQFIETPKESNTNSSEGIKYFFSNSSFSWGNAFLLILDLLYWWWLQDYDMNYLLAVWGQHQTWNQSGIFMMNISLTYLHPAWGLQDYIHSGNTPLPACNPSVRTRFQSLT